ncbi:MAG: hypothetical protein K0R63_1309 [Rickettsiales bacterium]|jgi:hypothetical protein|nr:hypothetical protein [Rickettsiales bacterium]
MGYRYFLILIVGLLLLFAFKVVAEPAAPALPAASSGTDIDTLFFEEEGSETKNAPAPVSIEPVDTSAPVVSVPDAPPLAAVPEVTPPSVPEIPEVTTNGETNTPPASSVPEKNAQTPVLTVPTESTTPVAPLPSTDTSDVDLLSPVTPEPSTAEVPDVTPPVIPGQETTPTVIPDVVPENALANPVTGTPSLPTPPAQAEATSTIGTIQPEQAGNMPSAVNPDGGEVQGPPLPGVAVVAPEETLRWKGSLMFRPEEISSIEAALHAFIIGVSIEPEQVEVATGVEESAPAEAVVRPELPSYFVNSIMYLNPSHWSVWVNGQKITNKTKDTIPSVVSVSGERVTLVWQTRELDIQVPSWRNKLPTFREGMYSSKEYPIIYDQEKGEVSVRLRSNQRFVARNLTIEEGKPLVQQGSVEELQVQETQQGQEQTLSAPASVPSTPRTPKSLETIAEEGIQRYNALNELQNVVKSPQGEALKQTLAQP